MIDIMPAILAIVVLGIIWSIYRLHRNPDADFNFLDLIMERGRVSKFSCVMMGAFVLHSWIMLDLELHGKMTEGYLTVYGATWIAPIIAQLFNREAASAPPVTTTTTTASAVTTTTQKGKKC